MKWLCRLVSVMPRWLYLNKLMVPTDQIYKSTFHCSMYPLSQSPCSLAGQWRTHIHHHWRHCSARKQEWIELAILMKEKTNKRRTTHQAELKNCIFIDLIEKSKNIIQIRAEKFQGFEQAIFISPQQLSHCAGGEQAFPSAFHVGRDNIGHDRIVLESFHHCLPREINKHWSSCSKNQ